MEKKLQELDERVEQLYTALYCERVRSVDRLIKNNITDYDELSQELDRLLDYGDNEKFMKLFWKLVNYVEKFDQGLGAEYRRQEEILVEGI